MKMKMDPAIRRMLFFGVLGLVIASGLVAAFQFTPASVLSANGTVQIQFMAAPADVSGGGVSCRGGNCNFTSIMVTVDSVSVHRSGALNLTADWITVVNKTTTIDLVQLANTGQIFGSASVPEGKITQVRMSVSHATGKLVNGSEVTMIVPSGELKLNLNETVTVRGATTTTIAIQIAPHIVHTGNEEWKLTPVLKQVKTE